MNPDSINAISAAVTALVTLIAAGAAIWAGIYAMRSFNQMKTQTAAATHQVQMAREDRERSQAEQVAAWSEDRYEMGILTLNLKLQNASTRPIYNLSIGINLGTVANPHVRYVSRKDFCPPNGAEPSIVHVHAVETLDAWQQWMKKRSKNLAPLVELVFADAAGQGWRRCASGALEHYEIDRGFPEHWVGRKGQSLSSIAPVGPSGVYG